MCASAARDAERRDEDIKKHDEVEQVGGHVLPERHLAESKPLLTVLVLFLNEEGVVLLSFGKLLLGLGLVLLTYRHAEVFTGPGKFLLELSIARRFLQRLLDDLGTTHICKVNCVFKAIGC